MSAGRGRPMCKHSPGGWPQPYSRPQARRVRSNLAHSIASPKSREHGRERPVARRGKLFCAHGGAHYRAGVFGKNSAAMAGAAVLLLAFAACEKEKTILP